MKRTSAIKFFPSFMLLISMILSGCGSDNDTPEASDHQNINVYVYHDFPPFTGRQDSIPDLSVLLIEKLNNIFPEINITFHKTSKPKVIEQIKRGESLMILWVNPLWFKNFLPVVTFSDPVLWDSDHLMSSQTNPVFYKNKNSLFSKKQCGVDEHFYEFSDALVKSGKVVMHYEPSMQFCINALDRGDVDFVPIEKSAWLNILTREERSKYYLSEKSVDSFSRSILLSRDLSYLLPSLNRMIKSLKEDNDWQEQIRSIGGEEFLDLFNLELFELVDLEVE